MGDILVWKFWMPCEDAYDYVSAMPYAAALFLYVSQESFATLWQPLRSYLFSPKNVLCQQN